jgi:hypothetical protein
VRRRGARDQARRHGEHEAKAENEDELCDIHRVRDTLAHAQAHDRHRHDNVRHADRDDAKYDEHVEVVADDEDVKQHESDRWERQRVARRDDAQAELAAHLGRAILTLERAITKLAVPRLLRAPD